MGGELGWGDDIVILKPKSFPPVCVLWKPRHPCSWGAPWGLRVAGWRPSMRSFPGVLLDLEAAVPRG